MLFHCNASRDERLKCCSPFERAEVRFCEDSKPRDHSDIPSNILVPRKWIIDCAKDKDDTDLIKEELKNAKRIAKYARDHIDDDSDDTKHYVESFVSEELRKIGGDYIVNQL